MKANSRKYEEAGDSGSMESLSQRLAADLRRQVKRLSAAEMLTPEWFEVLESLQHITNIAVMEQRLPQKSDDGTLWERDELTVRYVLEEGKLNVCLRALVQHKAFVANSELLEVKVKDAAAANQMEVTAVETKLRACEKCLGVLMKCCYRAVEALQTSDMGILLKHCTDVLKAANEDSYKQEDADKMQESVVLHYVKALSSRIHQLQEDQVMGLVKDEKLFAYLVKCIHKHGALIEKETLKAGLQALSALCETEYFSTYKSQLLLKEGDLDTAASLRIIKAEHMGQFTCAGVTERKGYQALLDEMSKLEVAASRPGTSTGGRSRIQSGRDITARIAALANQ